MKILRHKLIAGNTSRPGHLKLNSWASGGLLVWAASKLPILGGTSYIDALSWGTIAASCFFVEVIMPPDVDLAENWSGSELYHYWWKVFGDKTPHHSKWSHSLLFGLPLRTIWCMVPLVILMSGIAMLTLAVLEWKNVDAAVPLDFLATALNQAIAIDLFRNMAIGGLISDVVHYTLDDFNPIQMMIGQRTLKEWSARFKKWMKKRRNRKNATRGRKPMATSKARPRAR